jgi:hypothetical protein
MNIEQLQNEIKAISENTNLTKEEKIARIKIYQAYIESSIQKAKYNELMLDYIGKATKLVSITKGAYQVDERLDDNKLGIKGHIDDSDLIKYLESSGITYYTIDELSQHAMEYAVKTGADISDINLAIDLYKKTDELEDIEKNQMKIISRNLGDILGKNIISKTTEKNVIQSDGKAVVQLTDKMPEEIQSDYHKAIQKIDELYVNEGVLDLKTKDATTQMLNELFNYYTKGNKKVPMKVVEQMQNQQTYDDNEITL